MQWGTVIHRCRPLGAGLWWALPSGRAIVASLNQTVMATGPSGMGPTTNVFTSETSSSLPAPALIRPAGMRCKLERRPRSARPSVAITFSDPDRRGDPGPGLYQGYFQR